LVVVKIIDLHPTKVDFNPYALDEYQEGKIFPEWG
jgi:hypothetical protein